jgi:hypothetical protein
MVQRRTDPCTLAAALTAAHLLTDVGARTVEALTPRTGVFRTASTASAMPGG